MLVGQVENLLGPLVVGSSPERACGIAQLDRHDEVAFDVLVVLTAIGIWAVAVSLGSLAAFRTAVIVPFLQSELVDIHGDFGSGPFIVADFIKFLFELLETLAYVSVAIVVSHLDFM